MAALRTADMGRWASIGAGNGFPPIRSATIAACRDSTPAIDARGGQQGRVLHQRDLAVVGLRFPSKI